MAKRKKHYSDDGTNEEEEDDHGSLKADNNFRIMCPDNHQQKKKKNKSKKTKVNGDDWNDEEITAEQLSTEKPHELADVRFEWTEEDMFTLIKRIEIHLPKEDTFSYLRRVSRIDWEKVKFDPYSAEDCKKKFQEILSKQRTYRLLSEILVDIREWVKKPWTNNSNAKPKRHPDMPTQPLSSYLLFAIDKKPKVQEKHPNLSVTEYAKLLGEMFKNLPEEKKEKYKLKALKLREEYNAKLKEFYDKHPDAVVEKKKPQKSRTSKIVEQIGPFRPLPPFKLFYESKMDKHKDDPDLDSKKMLLKCKEQWKKMPDKKKSVWIKWTLDREQEYLVELAKYAAEHPDFDTTKLKQSVLTKEDRAILDRMAGKPKKPPNSAYGYFCSINMANDSYHSGQIKLKDLAERWKALSEVEKKSYTEKIKKLQENYKKDFSAYLETLPEEKRIEELQKFEKLNQKKKSPPVKENNQPTISKWIEKKKEEMDDSYLYKNEPPPPPGTAFDYFLKKFSDRHPELSKDEQLASAKLKWDKLPYEKKNRCKEELQNLKNKFVKEYAVFLKNLNEKELGEYSVLRKKRQLKSDSDESDDSSSSSKDDSNSDDDPKKKEVTSSSTEDEDSD